MERKREEKRRGEKRRKEKRKAKKSGISDTARNLTPSLPSFTP
jgi:hypothetical protein